MNYPFYYKNYTPSDKYDQEMRKLDELLKKSTDFKSNLYQGHMNYDVSKPHIDVLIKCLPYNQNNVAVESSPSLNKLEAIFVKDMCKLVGYDSSLSWGYITSGGTVCNLEALWIARNKKKQAKYVFAPIDSHYSINKACDILGLELKNLDEIKDYPENEICCIVLLAGATETGRVDDLNFYKTEYPNIRIHVDAAWGGYFLYVKDFDLSNKAKFMMNNMFLADSITIDPHKFGFAPYNAGLFLLKNVQDTKYINAATNTPYLGTSSISKYTVEGSRSSAICTSTAIGHEIIKDQYKTIITSCLIKSTALRNLFKSDYFRLYEGESDLCMVLFTQKEKILPDDYLKNKFCAYDNTYNNRLQLVSTVINNIMYFRCVIMDPEFDIEHFMNKLNEDYEYYRNQFENYVNTRMENIMLVAEEVDVKDELEQLIRNGEQLIAYNGFEPSGRIHIAQAVITVLNVNQLTSNGCKFILYIADWFAKLNHKMGGDLDKIQTVGRYFIEVFKACGLNTEQGVEFVWASDLMNNDAEYWPTVLKITESASLSRTKKCCQIMGRSEGDNLDTSQIIYPCMQAADIFRLGVNVCQLGIDQRKCNMLARDVAHKVGYKKPIVLSHHMLIGLKGKKGGIKMSKSVPDSAIFMEDSESEVNRKIMAGFCDDEIDGNPIFEYIRYIIIRWFGKFTINNKEYSTWEELSNDWKELNKKDVKIEVARNINEILEPCRKKFSESPMKELAEAVRSFIITR